MELTFDQIESLLKKTETDNEWGTYYMGKFYFTIKTGKKRDEVGLTDETKTLDDVTQRKLQNENYIALFHEYIHYLHELSTVVGNCCMALDLAYKSIFSRNFDKDLSSSTYLGINKKDDPYPLSRIIPTIEIIFGDDRRVFNEGKFFEITKIDYRDYDIFFPYKVDFASAKIKIPIISFKYSKDGGIHENHLKFGKYFLYEGLAYELDREVDKQLLKSEKINDYLKGTEYTVLRTLAKFIFPKVETRTYLSLAILSLQYIDPGSTFIYFLAIAKSNYDLGIEQEASVKSFKEQVSKLLNSKSGDFIGAQDEFKEIFLNRKGLSQAFGYITDKIKKLYKERIENPTFEIDYVFEGRHAELLNVLEVCDYMYLFQDEDDYMRDYLGTSIDEETSHSLKILLSYDHYHKKHKINSTEKLEATEEVNCPFFRCCSLPLRKNNGEICKKKPWRIFEVSAKSDNQYCWYGQGVLEFKGHNEKK